MISLGGGNPNPTYFPIKELELTLKDGDTPIAIGGEDLDAALSYSPSYGIPRLVEWLKDHQLKEHNPPYKKRDDWHVCVTTGSSEGNSKAFDMLLDEGDHVLTENPTYSGALAGLRPLGCHLTGIKTDQFGVVPAELRRVLENWPKQNPLPKALYIIPTGQNPSGSTLALERRHEIYSLASKFNFLILEDDPYYHLQLAENPKHVPSFFSLDTEGRVLRFDSFSKIISSGLRLGWVTGPMPLVERIQLHQQSSSLHASGLAQIVLLRILEKWGQKGLEDHLRAVRKGYTERRDTFCRLAEKYLSGLAEWSAPEAGMFVWFKIPGIDSTEKLIKERAVQQKVLLVPGAAFTPQEGEPSPYVRASFSTATTEEMEEALKRFANLITEERKARQK